MLTFSASFHLIVEIWWQCLKLIAIKWSVNSVLVLCYLTQHQNEILACSCSHFTFWGHKYFSVFLVQSPSPLKVKRKTHISFRQRSHLIEIVKKSKCKPFHNMEAFKFLFSSFSWYVDDFSSLNSFQNIFIKIVSVS